MIQLVNNAYHLLAVYFCIFNISKKVKIIRKRGTSGYG